MISRRYLPRSFALLILPLRAWRSLREFSLSLLPRFDVKLAARVKAQAFAEVIREDRRGCLLASACDV
jgi:hypothetical protein